MSTESIIFDDSFNSINCLINSNLFNKTNNSSKKTSLIKCRNIGLSRSTKKRKNISIKRSPKNLITTPNISKSNGKENKIENIKKFNFQKANKIKTQNESKSIVCTQQLANLGAWGLPETILSKYAERGITKMFPWQVECLSNNKILTDSANLLYSAPTSAGKTLIAEILTIKTVLERKLKVLIILPFVSVVREKMFYFQEILSSSGVRVEGFMGSYKPPGSFSSVHIAISTIEKANNIVNKLLEENEIGTLGAVVIDELHLLGDPNRGYLLELLLTKLLYMSCKNNDIKIQLIGMSATLPNLSLLATWLNAELYKTEFRPIPLYEQCYIDGVLYNSKFEEIRKIGPHPDIPRDVDNIIQLCLETIYCSCSVLIFCTAKNWCETLAQQIANTFKLLGRSEDLPLGKCLREQLNKDLILEVLEQLKRCPIGLDTVLKTTVSFGVAFHHAGLTMDERDIIEGAFRRGALRVLVATSTLSSGVNLPARRVIIRSPMFAGRPIDISSYKQMIGRAGRMGKDVAGESILICQKNEKYAAEKLLSAELQPISSCLEMSGRLKRAILEVIASGVANSPSDVKLFTKCTLLAYSDEIDEVENPIADTVDFLQRNEFIKLQKDSNDQMCYTATSLAKACLSSSLPPEEGLTLLAELERARECFVLESELHIIYLVTPYSACNQWANMDWMHFYSLWEQLSACDRRIGELVGVSESYIARAMSGRQDNSKNIHCSQIHRRFYTALALRELVDEVPLNEVAEKYKCNRGLLQSLQQSASTFAGMVTAFSHQLGWSNIELLVSQFQDRLQFGVNRELLDLMRLPSINGIRARALFNAGIETVVSLASVDLHILENALYKALPFQSERNKDEEENDVEQKKVKRIWISGKNALTEREAAEILIKEAQNFLKYEVGLVEAKWDNGNDNSTSHIENDSEEYSNDLNVTKQLNSESNNSTETSQVFNKMYITLESITENSINNQLTYKIEIEPENIKNENISMKYKNRSDNENKNINNMFTVTNEQNIPENIKNSEKNVFCNQFKTEKNKKIVESEDLFSNNMSMDATNNIKKIQQISEACKTDVLSLENDVSKNILQTVMENIFLSSNISPNSANNNTLSKKNLSSNISPNLVNNIFQNQQNTVNGNSYTWSSLNGHQLSEILNNANKIDCQKNLSFKLNNDTSFDNTNISGSLFEESLLIDTNLQVVLDNNLLEENLISNDNINLSKINLRKFKKYDTEIELDMNDDLNIKIEDKNSEKFCSSGEIMLKKDSLNNSNFINSDLEKAFVSSFNIQLNTSTDNKKIDQIFNSSRLNNETIASLEQNVNLTIQNQHELSNIKKDNINLENNFFNTKLENKSVDKDDDDIVLNSNDESFGTPQLHSKFLERTKKFTSRIGISETKHKTTEKMTPRRKKIILPSSTENINKSNKRNLKLISPVALKKDKIETIRTHSKKINFTNVEIIDVCEDKDLFDSITYKLLNSDQLSITIACEKYNDGKSDIGEKMMRYKSGSIRKYNIKSKIFFYKEYQMVGFSIFNEKNIVYFFSLMSENVELTDRSLELLQKLFMKESLTIQQFDCKEQLKLLFRCCNIDYNCKFYDPKIVDWLLEPEAKEKNLHSMIVTYAPDLTTLARKVGKSQYQESWSRNINSSISSRIRSTIEALVIWYITEAQQKKILKENWNMTKIIETEMGSLICLSRMELIGFGVCTSKLENILSFVQDKMAEIETRCYYLVGKRFSLSSPSEVAKVLKLTGTKKGSTTKEALEKLENPLAPLIILWRKLNSTLTKILFPLLRSVESFRVYGCSDCFSQTGRISMYEPNLQNVPRNFLVTVNNSSTNLSIRSAFVPKSGFILISADYCQLELRLLAHLSQDDILCNIMKSSEDIFRLIAAKWNKISVTEVDDTLRQRVKHLCYGIIYGMGPKTLAEQLELSDEFQASKFIESFKDTYPKIREFIQNTIEKCKERGYVETIYGRRRYLKHINNKSNSLRNRAERQAINTTIQGSAADIVKTAMIHIDATLRNRYQKNVKSISNLVLHLHDELLYETDISELNSVVLIIKNCMENAVNLSIPFPVKVRYGFSWGELKETKV